MSDSIRRRGLLAAVGALLALGGCQSENPPTEPTDTPQSSSDEHQTATLLASPPDNPDNDFPVGESRDGSNPHELIVQNDAEDERTVTIRIVHVESSETVLDQTYSLAGYGEVRGEIRYPAVYQVRIRVAESDATLMTTVDYFDSCNDFWTTVTVDADGITSSSASTEMGCIEEEAQSPVAGEIQPTSDAQGYRGTQPYM